jgi:hypothetical protein
MAQALILIPTLIALAMLTNQSAGRVALKVYVPCIMLVPMYMQFHLGGLALNVTTFVSLFLAVVGVYTWCNSLRFIFLDGCVLAYALSGFMSDFTRHDAKLGVYGFLLFFSKCVCPYWIGRTLIEQTGLRKEFVRTFVLCMAVIAILSLYEYKTETNVFQDMVVRITHTWVDWGRQSRWGFARIAGPYGHAIVAGIIFSTGLMLQLWLVGTKSWNSPKLLSFIRSKRKPLYVTLAILMGLFMTQSRGPWIGCVFGLIVASIGFARDRRRAAVLSLSALAIAAAVATVGINKYTDIDDSKVTDRDQLNASYRRELISIYTPVIEQGGLWGWGTPQILSTGRGGYSTEHDSIDNHYLFVGLWQGYAGLGLLVTMIGLTFIHLIKLCVTFRSRDDILFAYCMLGAMVAIAFSASTVSLTDPMSQILYLFLGWCASIRPTRTQQETLAPVATSRFAFQRVFA